MAVQKRSRDGDDDDDQQDAKRQTTVTVELPPGIAKLFETPPQHFSSMFPKDEYNISGADFDHLKISLECVFSGLPIYRSFINTLDTKHIRVMTVDRTVFDDSGSLVVAHTLATNETIKHLIFVEVTTKGLSILPTIIAQNTTLKSLTVVHGNLLFQSSSFCDMASALSVNTESKITRFSFKYNDLFNQDVGSFMKVLSERNIKSLEFDGDMGDVLAFISAIPLCPTLGRLTIKASCIGGTRSQLTPSFSFLGGEVLSELNFKGVPFTYPEMKVFVESLRANKSLKDIAIASSLFDEQGFELLMNCLHEYHNIESLDLTNNQFSGTMLSNLTKYLQQRPTPLHYLVMDDVKLGDNRLTLLSEGFSNLRRLSIATSKYNYYYIEQNDLNYICAKINQSEHLVEIYTHRFGAVKSPLSSNSFKAQVVKCTEKNAHNQRCRTQSLFNRLDNYPKLIEYLQSK